MLGKKPCISRLDRTEQRVRRGSENSVLYTAFRGYNQGHINARLVNTRMWETAVSFPPARRAKLRNRNAQLRNDSKF